LPTEQHRRLAAQRKNGSGILSSSVSNIKDGQTTVVWIASPPSVALSPPTTHSTNGGSVGGDSISLIGDKVFSAVVTTACKSNFSALRWLAWLAQLTDEGVDGAEPWCTGDGIMGARDASTPANNLARWCCCWWANASLPGRGSWADMTEYVGNTGGDGRPYPRATFSGY
jgi:hypothetical protein